MKGKLYNQEPTCTEELRLHQIREINPFISKRPGLQSPGLKQEQLNSELPWADSCAVCKCGHPLWRSGQGVTQVRMEPSMQEMIWTMKRDIKGGQHPHPYCSSASASAKQTQSTAARVRCKSTPRLSSFKLCMGAKGGC